MRIEIGSHVVARHGHLRGQVGVVTLVDRDYLEVDLDGIRTAARRADVSLTDAKPTLLRSRLPFAEIELADGRSFLVTHTERPLMIRHTDGRIEASDLDTVPLGEVRRRSFWLRDDDAPWRNPVTLARVETILAEWTTRAIARPTAD